MSVLPSALGSIEGLDWVRWAHSGHCQRRRIRWSVLPQFCSGLAYPCRH